jgi:hypothetical protein
MRPQKATANPKSVLVQVHEISALKTRLKEKPAELNMVELSMRESRLVLEALGIAISQQRRALEVCKKARGEPELMRAIGTREKQIVEFENLQNRVVRLLKSMAVLGSATAVATTKTTNIRS